MNEYRRTWAQIIGGFGLLLGLYFTWRRIEISQQELEATRDQQVTERFTRAIDQLGATDNEGKNKKLEIRLGGIYALERIAGDSLAMDNYPGRDYYGTVIEVLTAYVRENTLQAPGPSEGSSVEASISNETSTDADEGAEQAAPPEPRRPTADIQAILDVLRRAQARVPEEYRTRLDLREADLAGANLEGAELQEANLMRANLQGANLQGADLERTNLQVANFQGADLEEADLAGAYLQEANLIRANLFRASLEEASLTRANLMRANLQGADLSAANLQKAKVTDAQLADTWSLRDATMPDGSEHP